MFSCYRSIEHSPIEVIGKTHVFRVHRVHERVLTVNLHFLATSMKNETKNVFAVNAKGRRIGESHHRAKLTELDVELILYLRSEGLSYGQIARKFDDGVQVSKSTVRDICRGLIRAQHASSYKRADKS